MPNCKIASRSMLFFSLLTFALASAPRNGAAAAPTFAPCPNPFGLQSITVDPANTITVVLGQEFAVALRGAPGGNVVWRVRPPAAGITPPWKFVRTIGVPDVSFQNADRAAGSAMVVDGDDTEISIYEATAPGTGQLIYDLFQIGTPTPQKTQTYNVVIKGGYVC